MRGLAQATTMVPKPGHRRKYTTALPVYIPCAFPCLISTLSPITHILQHYTSPLSALWCLGPTAAQRYLLQLTADRYNVTGSLAAEADTIGRDAVCHTGHNTYYRRGQA